jgi:hypothetical protein
VEQIIPGTGISAGQLVFGLYHWLILLNTRHSKLKWYSFIILEGSTSMEDIYDPLAAGIAVLNDTAGVAACTGNFITRGLKLLADHQL